VIEGYVEQVRTSIMAMIERGRQRRENFAEQTLKQFRAGSNGNGGAS